MLKLVQVTKDYAYGNEILTVVKRASFEVARGSFTALIGPSGCGKSTLLNLIGALDIPTQGQIFFDNREVSKLSEKEKETYRLQKIGTIFQSFNLIPHLTAIENIEVPMIIAGVSLEKRRKRSAELIELVGLSDRKNHKPNQLSGGQKQRVSIARALALEPEILLADEPTGALDSQNSAMILDLLKEINQKQGTTIIMVTHSSEMAAHADHLIKMRDGQIIEEQKLISHRTIEVNFSRKVRKMPLSAALRNAMTNLIKKKWRSLLVCLGSSIGICGIALIIGLGMGIENQIKKEISPLLDPLTIKVTQNEPQNEPLTVEKLKELTRIDGVLDAFQTYEMQVEISYEKKRLDRVGIQSAKPITVNSKNDTEKLLFGYYPQQKNEILLSKTVAKLLLDDEAMLEQLIGKQIQVQFFRYASNDTVEQIPVDMKISGILVQGFLGVLEYPLVDHSFAQELYEKDQKRPYAIIKESNAAVYAQSDIKKVQLSLERAQFSVTPPDIIIKTITKYSKIAQAVLSFFAGISLVVSSIMIGIVLYTSVLERTKEIGILKALGARRKDILRIFVTEAGWIGFIAGTMGLIIASSIGLIGNALFRGLVLKNAQGFDIFVFPLMLWLSCILLSTILSICAGWLPARRASRLNPIDALKYE